MNFEDFIFLIVKFFIFLLNHLIISKDQLFFLSFNFPSLNDDLLNFLISHPFSLFIHPTALIDHYFFIIRIIVFDYLDQVNFFHLKFDLFDFIISHFINLIIISNILKN